MNNTEQISLVASALAIVALVNWLAGDRSFRGRELAIRQGSAWSACRWLGLGLWIASVIATAQDDLRLEITGFTGSLILLVGTARQTAKARTFNKSISMPSDIKTED